MYYLWEHVRTCTIHHDLMQMVDCNAYGNGPMMNAIIPEGM